MSFETLVTRIGISPVKPDYTIGAYRTLMANTLLSTSAEKGISYIRIDDTNPVKHIDNNIEPLLRNYMGLIGPTEVIQDVSPGLDGIYKTSLGLIALRQSLRGEKYKEAVCELKDVGFIAEEDGASYFELDLFMEEFGDTLEQPYVNSKTHRSVNLRSWRGVGNGESTRFPVMVRGRALYHLATVVDDTDLGVTHVVRGSDKIDSQVAQDVIRRTLGLDRVTHAYSKMMIKYEGQNTKLHDLITQGFSVTAIRSYILSSLTGKPDKIYETTEEASRDFDITKIRPTADKYDEARLKSIQRKINR